MIKIKERIWLKEEVKEREREAMLGSQQEQQGSGGGGDELN
jgi:hypothetical protein